MPDLKRIRITASNNPSYYQWLPTLPWHLRLEEWPNHLLAALPRGISRHIVRFIRQDQQIFAVKEIAETGAIHEYQMLQKLQEAQLPVVVPAAVVSNRVDQKGEELPSVIITEHLQYSLPYRVILSQTMSEARLNRILDSLVVLLVRLHLSGFYWGDMSLSNTLFRRDAGTYACYLVDAETGKFYRQLSRGQREYDVDLGCTNIIGELMDLQMGGFMDPEMDVSAIGEHIFTRYQELWADVTESQRIPADELWRIGARTERLNNLGFDIGEIDISSDQDGAFIRIQPRVVESGHFHRRIRNLTGLNVEEEQARRIEADIRTFQAERNLDDLPPAQVAMQWMNHIYLPTIQAIPANLRHKLEPAQILHEVLEHRWYMAEKAGRHVHTADAVQDYIANILSKRLDEQVVLSMPLTVSTPKAPY